MYHLSLSKVMKFRDVTDYPQQTPRVANLHLLRKTKSKC